MDFVLHPFPRVCCFVESKLKCESMNIFLILALELKEVKRLDFEIVDLKVDKVFPKSLRKIPREKKVPGFIWVELIIFSKKIK